MFLFTNAPQSNCVPLNSFFILHRGNALFYRRQISQSAPPQSRPYPPHFTLQIQFSRPGYPPVPVHTFYLN